MPACRWGNSTVTTRRPLSRTLLWTGSVTNAPACRPPLVAGEAGSSGPARIRARSRLRNGAHLGLFQRGRRKPQREDRAGSGRALAGELPAVLLRHFLRHGEAEARAALLGGEERVEDALQPLAGDARAGILDLDLDGALAAAGSD